MSLDYVQAKNSNDPSGYRSTSALTWAVLSLLGTHAVLSAILGFGFPAALRIVRASESGTLLDGASFSDAIVAIVVGVGTYLQIGVFIACAVCFLCWLHRGYSNLPALGSESVIATPKSAVVGWFIPFANLVHGYRSVHVLYLESQRPAILPSGFVLPTRAAIVGWWWGAYLARGVISRIAEKMMERSFGDDAAALGWFWTSQTLDLVAAVLCMIVVYRVDRRQREQWDDLQRRAQAPQPQATLR